MENRYIETHKTWNKLAQRYEDQFMDIELYNDTYERFCSFLAKKNASLLEIGCGPGNISRHLLNAIPTLKILATDVSKNMVDLAKKNNPNLKTQALDCRKIHTIQNKFEGIICGFVLPYLSKVDCAKLIADCSSLLSKNGVLYLSFVSDDHKKSGFIGNSSGERVYFYYHEIDTIRHKLELNDLTVVDFFQKEYKKSKRFSELHTVLIAKKQEPKKQ